MTPTCYIVTKQKWIKHFTTPLIIGHTPTKTTNTIKFLELSTIRSLYVVAALIPHPDREHDQITTEIIHNRLVSNLQRYTYLELLFPVDHLIKRVAVRIYLRNEQEKDRFTTNPGSPIFFSRSAKAPQFSILSTAKTDTKTATELHYEREMAKTNKEEQD